MNATTIEFHQKMFGVTRNEDLYLTRHNILCPVFFMVIAASVYTYMKKFGDVGE